MEVEQGYKITSAPKWANTLTDAQIIEICKDSDLLQSK